MAAALGGNDTLKELALDDYEVAEKRKAQQS